MIRRVAAAALGAAVLLGFTAAQAPARQVPEPRGIRLVSAETGLELEGLHWRGQDQAAGELDLTGEGAADLGPVQVTITRAPSGALVSLRLTGNVTVSKSWTLSNGKWSAK